MTYQAGPYDVPGELFMMTGTLNNTVTESFWPSFAFAHDLTVGILGPTVPVVYAIGHERDPLVQISNIPSTNATRRPYYITRHGSVLDMVYPLCDSCLAVLTWPLHRLAFSSMTTPIPWRVRPILTTS